MFLEFSMSMRSFRLNCEGVAAPLLQCWSLAFDASLDFLSPSFGGYDECFLDIVSFLLSSALMQN